MLARHGIQTIRRWIIASARRIDGRGGVLVRRRRSRSELQRVNAALGIEPLRPALSGLKLRRANVPRRLTRLLIHLAYRWQPSQEYRRRQGEMRDLNRWLKHRPRKSAFLPPILLYTEDTDLLPKRVQPLLDSARHSGSPLRGEMPRELRDLRDLQEAADARRPWFLRPRLPEPDPEYFLSSRPLLPRQYRRFLRHSLYPRLALTVAAALIAVFGFLRVNQVQRAEAGALVRFHHARSAFRTELDAARAYGVGQATLRTLERQAGSLEARPAPLSFALIRARASFYAAQARRYRALLRALRLAERRALAYWTWQEGNIYAALVEATQAVNGLGLHMALPPIPACATPACDRSAVASQAGRAAWLRETAATLRVYGAAIAAAPDPVSAAGTEVQEARTLAAILPAWATPPARIADLDAMYATATGIPGYARVGALGRLDDDALQADLMRILPQRAIVVSIEDQSLTCYQRGKAIYTSPVTAGSATPIGIFHIQARQASISTLYWSQTGRSYRLGSLPDWMAFSGGNALQAAPWRSVFGPGSDTVQPAYAPATPGSIDLPPAAARSVFGWAPAGTEVVVY